MNSNAHQERAMLRWTLPALAYFVAAIALGVGMAASHDFRLKGLHVHLNLLGWVSMVLMGTIYRLVPGAAASRLAAWHFGLYQAALPLMMIGLGGLLLGHLSMEPLVAVGSIVVLVSVLLFAAAIVRAARARHDKPASALHLDQVGLAA